MKIWRYLLVTFLLFIYLPEPLYSENPPIQITNNNYEDRRPRIHNGLITWSGWDGSDWEIFFWDGRSISQITDNSYDDYGPEIHNGQITWSGDKDRSNHEIFFWDGQSVIQFTDYIFQPEQKEIPIYYINQNKKKFLYISITF